MIRYLLLLLLTVPLMARGQTQGSGQLTYWFDNDQLSAGKTESANGCSLHVEADVGHLSAGLHVLHTLYTNSDGVAGSPVTRTFVKTVGSEATGRYWFDNDSAKATVSLKQEAFFVDVSHLADGLHTFHLEACDRHGATSSAVTGTFVKLPQLNAIDSLTCRCSVDGDFWKQEQVAASSGQLSWKLDVSTLPQGFHRLMVEVLMPGGQSAGSYSTWFLREPLHAEASGYVCMYSIDGEAEQRQAGQMADGTWHFDLDVATLSDGFHRLTYYLNNLHGIQTESRTAFFIKTPIGGTGLTGWQWWLNDLTDDIHTTTLNQPVDPLKVITTLDVGHQPLRTQSFHFEAPADGQAAIYAKNQLHLRFSDVSQRSTEQVCDFVDREVSQPVTDIAELLSQPNHSFGRATEGAISWYYLLMTPGDSLQLWSSVQCRIEVFTPQGDILYKASDARSQQVGGFEAQDTMTCYIALHDQQNSGTLNYNYSKWVKPQLSIETDGDRLQEGQSRKLVIRRNRMFQVTIDLTLSTSHPDRVTIPKRVRIPAGLDSVAVSVCTVDDERYQIPDSVTFTVSAPRHDDGTLTLLLTDNDAPMDMAEWLLLRQWHEEQGGSDWKQSWAFGTTPELTDSLAGVLMRDGHVLEVRLPDNNLSGNLKPHLFQLPAIKAIDLSGNAISGHVDAELITLMGQNNTLHSLNISHNQIGGNVGLLCQPLIGLRQLDATYNRFAEVAPMVSPQVTMLRLENQAIDQVTALHLAVTTAEEVLEQLPSILLYDHEAQDYRTDINLRIEEPQHDWYVTMAWNDGLLTLPYVSEQNTYYGQQDDTLPVSVVDDANRKTGDTFSVKLGFDMGDANFNGQVDVLDLQTAINYIFDNYRSRPFNFTAANLDAAHDAVINVQDVVGLVSLLGELSPTADSPSGSHGAAARRYSAAGSAWCYIRDGRLMVESSVPVAAFDIVLDGSDVTVAGSLPSGMTCSIKRHNGQCHLIGYSLAGVTLPVGSIALCNLRQETARIVYAMLADAAAREIEVRIEQNEATGIQTTYSEVDGMEAVYDLQGRRVNTQSRMVNGQLKPGLYIKKGKKTVYKKK